jgi:transcriptional repressor NrdR
MKCPFCFAESRVIDKRESGELSANRRRRECLRCGKRFTTYERIETPALRVAKKDGCIEDFDRDKVRSGIVKACQKRPITNEQIDAMVDSIETELRKKDSTDVKTNLIGDMVMDKLKAIDKVAYIRFASVYRDFTDIQSFEKELEKLIKG